MEGVVSFIDDSSLHTYVCTKYWGFGPNGPSNIACPIIGKYQPDLSLVQRYQHSIKSPYKEYLQSNKPPLNGAVKCTQLQ